MKTAHSIFVPLFAGVALLVLPLSAQELAVPDFSKGMPDVNLEKKGKSQRPRVLSPEDRPQL